MKGVVIRFPTYVDLRKPARMATRFGFIKRLIRRFQT